jgi:hypothetical protein
MEEINDGGPAFPSTTEYPNATKERMIKETVTGMTLRQYYAAAALAGLIPWHGLWRDKDLESLPVTIAKEAFLLADEMIAHEKERPNG